MGAHQHQPVVVRLVAVPIDQDDVARLQQGLDYDLVGGRGAVGDEEGALGPEGPRRHLLRLLQRAGGIEQGIEPAGRGGGLGQEDVHAIELRHIPDPVGFDDGLAARDGQRMEDAGRLAGVLAQRVEEGCLVARADAAQDAEMKFEIILLAIEYASERVAEIASDGLDRNVGHQIEVDLGPQLADEAAQRGAAVAVGLFFELGARDSGQIALQQIELILGLERESIADDAGLDIVVEQDGDQRVLETGNDDDLVNETVVGAAHAMQAGAKLALLSRADVIDDQNFEIRARWCQVLGRRRLLALTLLFLVVQQ